MPATEIYLIRHGQTECAKQDRQRFDQPFGDAIQVADRRDQQRVQGLQRVMAEGDDEKLVSQVVKDIVGAVKKAAA